MIRPTDRLIGPRRGDADTAIAHAERSGAARLADVVAYILTVFRHAPAIGLDPAIVVSQSAHETGHPVTGAPWQSRAWRARLNPAGLGITDGPDHGYAWATGEDAALAQLHHLGLYVGVDVLPWKAHNPRWQAAVDAGMFGVATTLDDLTGRWATDSRYAEKIAAKGNALFPGIVDQQQEEPMNIPTTFSVPRPTIYDLATDYARFGLSQRQASDIIGSRFPNRNGGAPRFIVYHIQDGSTRGSLGWWARDDVDASSTVMVQKDGSVLRIVPEQHGPWTNGDVNRPTPQANEILALGGNPNNWSLTIEAEGGPWDTMPRAQRDAIVWVSEDWIMRHPRILDSTWCLLRHGFINSVSRPNCPGAYFNPVVADINAWLDGAGAPPTPEPDPEPAEPPSIYPPGMSPELARELYEAGGRFTASWTSKAIGFDPARSECNYWLARGRLRLKDGARYTATQWPHLVKITRRGKSKNVHAYVYSNGDVYEKVIRKDP